MIKHFEENLTTDIIWVVADYAELAVWVDDIAAHKKIAVRSNLCLLYLEVSSGSAPALYRFRSSSLW